MLFMQTRIMMKLTNNPEHPAVRESYRAAVNLVKAIHDIGGSMGKKIYVDTWNPPLIEGEETPPLDFITLSVSAEEVINQELDVQEWAQKISRIRDRFGNITVFAVLDWGVTDTSPLAVFSQKLSSEEQIHFLREASEALRRLGVLLIYPIHGGFVGPSAEKLAYGKYKFYDAQAPEFQTYEAIIKPIKDQQEERS